MEEKIKSEQEMESLRHRERQAVLLGKRKPHGERQRRRNGKSGSLPVRDNVKQTDRQTWSLCFFYAK